MRWVTETIADNVQDLIDAAGRGDISSVKALFDKGADVNVKDEDGGTALMWASRNSHTDVVQLRKKSRAKE